MTRGIRAGREGPEEFLLEAMVSGDASAAIENMEARGQRQLVESTMLPVDLGFSAGPGEQAKYEALGFEFGDVDPNDPIFREAKLPAGWTIEPSTHSMWSHIVDERGEERVSIFFKAAFYDRSAHMGLIAQCACGHSYSSHEYAGYPKDEHGKPDYRQGELPRPCRHGDCGAFDG